MGNFVKLMFSENNDVSAIRGMSFLSLSVGGLIALYGMYKNQPLTDLAVLSGTFVGSAFAGKVWQKKYENGVVSTPEQKVQ